MFLRAFIIALAVQQSLAYRIRADGCQIDLSSLNPEPIVVATGNNTFLYPDLNSQTISLDVGASIDIGCPGGTLSAGSTSAETVTAICVTGKQFTVDGETVTFTSIKCSRNPFHTARYTNATCEGNGKEAEIGFILSETDFVQQIRLCFDDTLQNTLYSHYHLTAAIGAHESGVSRPSFIEDDFYNVGSNSVNSLYERTGQRTAINALVGLTSSSTKYVQNSNDFFLSRGHLTAKADFVYAPQQRATFHYINVAPQWQTFNGQSWNNVEMQVRDYGDSNQLDLEVYTGTYGVTTLPHEETGEDVELYLYVDGNQNGIPVPELYWKVVYNPKTKEGVAILGINNPYQTDVSKSIICTDVSKSISWIKWTSDLTAGYIWACDVNDLRTSVTYLPDIEVNSLLV